MIQRLAATAALGLVAVLLLAAPAAAQQHPRRLILKDGTYQSVTEFKVEKGRVRYHSAERFEWEELPSELVDWPATERYEKDRQQGKLPPEAQIAAEEEAERAAEEARSPAVAPGLRLPATGGVFLLDAFHGEPQLLPLEQSGGEINRQMGKNILRAALNPLASVKQSIELAGARAAVQSHALRPTIYVNVDSGDAAEATVAVEGSPNGDESRNASAGAERFLTSRFRIVRAQPKKERRVVGNLKVTFFGKMSQEQRQVPVTSESMGGGWTKVIPLEPLPPGEYALVEMLGENEINLYVWDFGVDPTAPASPRAWKPVEAEKESKDKEPELQSRPKEQQ